MLLDSNYDRGFGAIHVKKSKYDNGFTVPYWECKRFSIQLLMIEIAVTYYVKNKKWLNEDQSKYHQLVISNDWKPSLLSLLFPKIKSDIGAF
jgi:hypothetical protein